MGSTISERTGGILTDIASHQFDQFPYFTGSTQVDIVAAEVASRGPYPLSRGGGLRGVLLRSERPNGYIWADRFTSDGPQIDCHDVVLPYGAS